MTEASPTEALRIEPNDAYNQTLVQNVHPHDWQNPTPSGRYNLVVVGGGTAGLICAIGAAGMGAKVALIESHLLGGDCLNFGCVPSKALIRAARSIYEVQNSDKFGVSVDNAEVHFSKVMERMRRLRSEISHHDSAERFSQLGIDVYIGKGSFISPKEIEVGGTKLSFAHAVIATGAKARVAAIPGLKEVGFLTSETVFSLTELPRRLIVIGAGPIGCELAQSFARLGSSVTIVGRDPSVLPREDTDAAAILAKQFESENIATLLGADIQSVDRSKDGSKVVRYSVGQETREVVADEILLAIGRVPNVEGMGLKSAGVEFSPRGVVVSDKMRTSNKRIYAAGDVCSRYQFTHAADAMARIVIQNALFFGRKKASALTIPWCTYTSPEIAHVGMSQKEAIQSNATTLTVPLASIDRAILEGDKEGFGRVHTDKKGNILGATLVAGHAGELIGEMSLAMTHKLTLGQVSQAIMPYPTQSEIWKRLGDQWNRTRLTPFVAWIAKKWLSWIR